MSDSAKSVGLAGHGGGLVEAEMETYSLSARSIATQIRAIAHSPRTFIWGDDITLVAPMNLQGIHPGSSNSARPSRAGTETAIDWGWADRIPEPLSVIGSGSIDSAVRKFRNFGLPLPKQPQQCCSLPGGGDGSLRHLCKGYV